MSFASLCFKLSATYAYSFITHRQPPRNRLRTSSLFITHADIPSEVSTRFDRFYGDREFHNADFLVISKYYSLAPVVSNCSSVAYVVNTFQLSSLLPFGDLASEFFSLLVIAFRRKDLLAFIAAFELFNPSYILNKGIISQIHSFLAFSRPKQVITTWEGHPWEHFLSIYCKRMGIKLFAYSHVGPYPYMYSAFSTFFSRGSLIPDDFLVPTDIAKQFLENQYSIQSTRVGTVKSSLLKRIMKDVALTSLKAPLSRSTVLLLPQGTLSEVSDFISLVATIKTENIYFLLRLHPSLASSPYISKLLASHSNDAARTSSSLSISNNPFELDLKKSMYFIYRGSSAAVEAAYCGLAPIYYPDSEDNRYSLNSLLGLCYPTPPVVRSASELSTLLNQYTSSPVNSHLHAMPPLHPLDFSAIASRV